MVDKEKLIKFLKHELPMYLIVLVMLVATGKGSYDEGFYDGMKVLCEDDIIYGDDNETLTCGSIDALTDKIVDNNNYNVDKYFGGLE